MSKRTLPGQVVPMLRKNIAFGESRHKAKEKSGSHRTETLHSIGQYHTIKSQCKTFARWVQANYPEIKLLKNTEHLLEVYLDEKIAEGKSPWTISTYRANISHLFGKSGPELFPSEKMPIRRAVKATKGTKYLDKDIPIERNHRSELDQLRNMGTRREESNDLGYDDISKDCKTVKVRQGKGGKSREVEVNYPELLAQYISDHPNDNGKLFAPHALPHQMNCHRERANFMKDFYHKRMKELFGREDADYHSLKADGVKVNHLKWYFMHDKSGRTFYKDVLDELSIQVGHNKDRHFDMVNCYLAKP